VVPQLKYSFLLYIFLLKSEFLRELAVLRSLGVNSNEIIMIYVFEALTIVISCVLIGVIIGLGTSASLIAQFTLFLNRPLILNFPWGPFIIQVVLAFFAAFVGSFMPASKFCKEPVARNFRYN